nr:MAG TPA: hypothetical protein [Bacteriophage sp.]
MCISYITNCYLSYRYICSDHWENIAPAGSIENGFDLKKIRVGVTRTGRPGTYLTPSSKFFSKRPYFT